MSSEPPLKKFALFVQKNIILIKGEKCYTIPINEEISESNTTEITHDGQVKEYLYYFHSIHIMIIMYHGNKKVEESVGKYINDVKNKSLLSNIDNYKIKRELNYFLLGNYEWVMEKLKTSSSEFDKIEPEEDRLIIMAIIMIYSGYSIKISNNMPIIGHDGNDLLNSVQIFRGLTKDNKYSIVSSKKSNYKLPGLIFNSMNYKMKTPDHVLKVLDDTKNLKKSLLENKTAAQSNIMKTIDALSLSEDTSSVYYMIQLISDLFNPDDISNVMNELKNELKNEL